MAEGASAVEPDKRRPPAQVWAGRRCRVLIYAGEDAVQLAAAVCVLQHVDGTT